MEKNRERAEDQQENIDTKEKGKDIWLFEHLYAVLREWPTCIAGIGSTYHVRREIYSHESEIPEDASQYISQKNQEEAQVDIPFVIGLNLVFAHYGHWHRMQAVADAQHACKRREIGIHEEDFSYIGVHLADFEIELSLRRKSCVLVGRVGQGIESYGDYSKSDYYYVDGTVRRYSDEYRKISSQTNSQHDEVKANGNVSQGKVREVHAITHNGKVSLEDPFAKSKDVGIEHLGHDYIIRGAGCDHYSQDAHDWYHVAWLAPVSVHGVIEVFSRPSGAHYQNTGTHANNEANERYQSAEDEPRVVESPRKSHNAGAQHGVPAREGRPYGWLLLPSFHLFGPERYNIRRDNINTVLSGFDEFLRNMWWYL